MARSEEYDLEEQKEANRQTASLAGLAAALFLVVVSLYVVHRLARETALEDCLLAGRTNCDLIVQHPF
jgi:flagellar biogenesis protein FliO